MTSGYLNYLYYLEEAQMMALARHDEKKTENKEITEKEESE